LFLFVFLFSVRNGISTLLIDMCIIYLHNTSYTARLTVLLVMAMIKKAKKYFLTSTFMLFCITQHYIKEKFLFFLVPFRSIISGRCGNCVDHTVEVCSFAMFL